MTDFLNTSLSGLLSFQRALTTTSHNIANVSTEGYSRQRVNLGALPPENIGTAFIGQGVQVIGIDRILDQFQVAQLRGYVTEHARLDVFTQLSSGVDGLLANSDTGLSQAMQEFFSGVQTVADSPSSITARQIVLSQANVLADRIETLQRRFEADSAAVDARLGASVSRVNALAASVADLNEAIVEASSAARGAPPNDLLDQRDLVLRELSELVSVAVVEQSDGALNVFVGSGQALVLGRDANSLTLVRGEFGSSEIALVTNNGSNIVIGSVNGGEIGGLLDFRREVLDPSRNSLGQLTVALAQTFNALHRQGMDLAGNLGGDFFATGTPAIVPSSQNTGAGNIGVTITDVTALTNADYVLAFDGATYTLTRTDTNAVIPLTGSGTVVDPFVADGLSIVVNTAPAAGDEFLLRPTHDVAGSFVVSLSDPAGFAAALPIRAAASLTNGGNGGVSGEEVLDVADPNLLVPVVIEFIDATTYMINGAGSFAYTEGAAIDVNGWRVRIDGAPVAGDQFTVSSNAGGVGDNRNALELAGALELDVLNGGSTSVREAYGNLVSLVSTSTRRSEINLLAQAAITEQAIADQLSVSGVNLDEEAANMVRFQQAYQAAAQLIGVADVLFQTILAAVRR